MCHTGQHADQPQCGDYAAGGSWGADNCGGGPINNARTVSALGGIKALLKLSGSNAKVTYAPGVPIADSNASAPYFTTIQPHSFSTLTGEPGLIGKYYASNVSMARNILPMLERNDYTLSFHFLNFGPDPVKLPASKFAARWEGFLTPDCSVDQALFNLETRGGNAGAKLWLDGKVVLEWFYDGKPHLVTSKPVVLEHGKRLPFKFEWYQEDQTAKHPAFALQWSQQGTKALDDAVKAASGADITIVVGGGMTSLTSGEGRDRSSLTLPGDQLELIQAIRAATIKQGTPMALVVVQGKPFAEPWIKQHIPAILEAWQGGQAQGTAIADVLFGAYNPAGRVSVSFPISADVLPAYYNRHPSASRGSYTNPPVIPGP